MQTLQRENEEVRLKNRELQTQMEAKITEVTAKDLQIESMYIKMEEMRRVQERLAIQNYDLQKSMDALNQSESGPVDHN